MTPYLIMYTVLRERKQWQKKNFAFRTTALFINSYSYTEIFLFLAWSLFIHKNLILTTQVYCDVFTHAGDLMLAHLLYSVNIACKHCTDQALDRHEVGSTIHNMVRLIS